MGGVAAGRMHLNCLLEGLDNLQQYALNVLCLSVHRDATLFEHVVALYRRVDSLLENLQRTHEVSARAFGYWE